MGPMLMGLQSPSSGSWSEDAPQLRQIHFIGVVLKLGAFALRAGLRGSGGRVGMPVVLFRVSAAAGHGLLSVGGLEGRSFSRRRVIA